MHSSRALESLTIQRLNSAQLFLLIQHEHHLFSLITVMPAVPRLLNRVYDKINNEIRNSAIKRLLFRMALKWVEMKKALEHDETLFWSLISFDFFISSKEKELRRGIIRKNSFWDKLVFKKVQDAFGGSLRLMVRLQIIEICRHDTDSYCTIYTTGCWQCTTCW